MGFYYKMNTYNLKTWSKTIQRKGKQEQVILRQELRFEDQLIGLHDCMLPSSDADTIQETSGSVGELTGPSHRETRKKLHNVIENKLVTHANQNEN